MLCAGATADAHHVRQLPDGPVCLVSRMAHDLMMHHDWEHGHACRYVAFLCARLLEVSVEERALHTIQKHWRLSRARRAGEHTGYDSYQGCHSRQQCQACLFIMHGDTVI